jgi:hypothetical protein
VALLGFLALASPAAAQSYLVDFGINGGFSLYTSMLGADEGFNGGSAKFATSWLAGSQLTIWPWSRVGLRANFAYADRALEADNEIWGHNNLWAGSGDLMIRLRAPNETWQGAETLPYLALGFGEKWFNPAGDQFVCYDTSRNEFWTCVPFDQATGAGSTFALGEWKESLMGLVGIGLDYRMSPRWLFRFELNDRIAKPQVQDVAGFLGGNVWDVPDGEENRSKWVHEIGAQVGISVALGLRSQEMVAAPPPPPPPAAAAATAAAASAASAAAAAAAGRPDLRLRGRSDGPQRDSHAVGGLPPRQQRHGRRFRRSDDAAAADGGQRAHGRPGGLVRSRHAFRPDDGPCHRGVRDLRPAFVDVLGHHVSRHGEWVPDLRQHQQRVGLPVAARDGSPGTQW